MGMDSVTAQLLLDIALNDPEKGADLYREINKERTGGPSKEAREFINQNLGKRVRNIGGMYGTLVGVNETDVGLYNGNRYPALIRLDTGQTFEYCLSTFNVLESEE